MQTICKMLGGSHSYGLQTPSSDIDHRGVYLHTNPDHILGLSCNVGEHEHIVIQDATQDVSYKEFRKALRLLREANTEMVELLYNENWIELHPCWERVIQNRNQLVDSEKLYKCLKGYMQGELRLANGERTGKLGGKRKEAIDKYGYSPKNFVQLFRLAWAGCEYFQTGVFPVKVSDVNKSFSDYLVSLKTEPQKHEVKILNGHAAFWESHIQICFEKRKVTTTFNEKLANELCYIFYGNILNSEEARRLGHTQYT